MLRASAGKNKTFAFQHGAERRSRGLRAGLSWGAGQGIMTQTFPVPNFGSSLPSKTCWRGVLAPAQLGIAGLARNGV